MHAPIIMTSSQSSIAPYGIENAALSAWVRRRSSRRGILSGN